MDVFSSFTKLGTSIKVGKKVTKEKKPRTKNFSCFIKLSYVFKNIKSTQKSENKREVQINVRMNVH